jgi:hypothetical protein
VQESRLRVREEEEDDAVFSVCLLWVVSVFFSVGRRFRRRHLLAQEKVGGIARTRVACFVHASFRCSSRVMQRTLWSCAVFLLPKLCATTDSMRSSFSVSPSFFPRSCWLLMPCMHECRRFLSRCCLSIQLQMARELQLQRGPSGFGFNLTRIDDNNILRVVDPGGPADLAGARIGDIVLKVVMIA